MGRAAGLFSRDQAAGEEIDSCSTNLRVIETLLVESRPRTSTSTEFSPEIRRQVALLIGNDVTLAIRKS